MLQPSACLQSDSLSRITAVQLGALMQVNYLDLLAPAGLTPSSPGHRMGVIAKYPNIPSVSYQITGKLC